MVLQLLGSVRHASKTTTNHNGLVGDEALDSIRLHRPPSDHWTRPSGQRMSHHFQESSAQHACQQHGQRRRNPKGSSPWKQCSNPSCLIRKFGQTCLRLNKQNANVKWTANVHMHNNKMKWKANVHMHNNTTCMCFQDDSLACPVCLVFLIALAFLLGVDLIVAGRQLVS